MGGFCPGGFCPGDFVLGGILSRGILSGGFCPGGFVRGDFVLEPATTLFTVYCKLFHMMLYIIILKVRKFHQSTASRFSTARKNL